MRAVRYHGQRDIRVESVPAPTCKDTEVKIAPAYVGLCGSDVHEYVAGPLTIPRAGAPHALTGETLPVILGHEISGTVTEVGAAGAAAGAGAGPGPGPGSTTLKPGDRVVVQPSLSCGTCVACAAGADHVCVHGGFVGISGGSGGLADECCVAAHRAFALPASVSLRHGALVEPFSISHHAAALAGMAGGSSNSSNGRTGPPDADAAALVLGAGPIGLALVQVLRKMGGVRTVVVSEVAAARRELARSLGATHVLDPRAEGADVAAAVHGTICAARGGADVVFDCAGVPDSLRTALRAVAPRGSVVNLALWEGPAPLSANLAIRTEARWLASTGATAADFEAVIAAFGRGDFSLEPMISGVAPLEKVVEGGLEELVGRRDAHVKILVEVGGGV